MTMPRTIEELLGEEVPDYSAVPDQPVVHVPLSPELQAVSDSLDTVLFSSTPLPELPSVDTRPQATRQDLAAARRAALLQRPTWTRDATVAELVACGLPEDDLRVMKYQLFVETFPHARRKADPVLAREFVRLSSGAQYGRRVTTETLRRQYDHRNALRSMGAGEDELPPLRPDAPVSGATETEAARRARIEALVEAGTPPDPSSVLPGVRGIEAQAERARVKADLVLYRQIARERRAEQRTAEKLDAKAAKRLAQRAESGDRDAERQLRLHRAIMAGGQDWGTRAIDDIASIGRQGREIPVAARHLQAAVPVWRRAHGSP
jgi:hypothetical protein